MDAVENVARQIGLIQTAIKRPFSPSPGTNERMINEIAERLGAAGTRDVRDLAWYEDKAADLSFFYDKRTGHPFETPFAGETGFEYIDGDRDPNAKRVIFVWQTKHDNYRVYVTASKDGLPIFYAVSRPRTSALHDWTMGVIFVASVVVTFAFPALGLQIGQAIMGPELAAAYPGVASGVGNAVVQTAFNGGDVQAAAVGAFSGGIGSLAGSVVQTATDSRIIGAVANAAVKSAVVGGDIKQAAGMALLSNGLSSLSQLDVFKGNDVAKTLGDSWGGDDSDVIVMDEGSGGVTYSPPDIDYHDPAYGDLFIQPAYQDIYATMGVTGSVVVPDPLAPPSGPSGIVASINGADLTKLALTTLQLVQAFRNAGSPPVYGSNAQTTANANGTISVRNANGTVSTRPMPVGTPYLTTAGTLVTNNGNGSYTTIDANGHPQTVKYPTGTAGLGLSGLTSNMPLMLGIAGIAAVVLLKGR